MRLLSTLTAPGRCAPPADGIRAIANQEEPVGRLLSRMEVAEGLVLDKVCAVVVRWWCGGGGVALGVEITRDCCFCSESDRCADCCTSSDALNCPPPPTPPPPISTTAAAAAGHLAHRCAAHHL